LSDQCEATYQDLRCILPAGHIGRHHDRATISTLAWDDPAPRTYTEQELAQATADALDLASEHVPNFGQSWNLASCSCGWEVKWDNQCEDRTRLWQQHIRALIPADIAAKAKEREDALQIAEAGKWLEPMACGHARCFRRFLIDQENPSVPKESCAICEIATLRMQSVEHDAKIRREACEALAWLATELEKRRSFMESNDNAWWEKYEHCRELAGLPRLTAHIPTWANEPPSGGKADGGGKCGS
jgi:hypothetical protein